MRFIGTLCLSALASAALLAMHPAHAGPPEGLDSSLQRLATLAREGDARAAQMLQKLPSDSAGRVLVTVRLQEGQAVDPAISALRELGFVVQHRSEVDARLLTGHLPPARLVEAQSLPAVSAVLSVRKPVRRARTGAGAVHSQSVKIHRGSQAAALGFTGQGIRVAVISDSFNRCPIPRCSTDAAADIASGDLPAAGVTVLSEAPSDIGGSDEGRAMLQLVHDMAPGAVLGFADAGDSSVSFANKLLALRRNFKADIIVDDIGFSDEPLFGDGLIAKAIDEVVRSGGAVFSAAGNDGQQAYETVYAPMAFDDARRLSAQGKIPVKIDQIPAAVRPHSFHVFGSQLDGRVRITQRLQSQGVGGVVQWDEPFDRGLVATDYNIYLFDNGGNWIDPTDPDFFYTTDDNRAVDRPAEFFNVPDGREVFVLLGKRNNGPAQRLKVLLHGIGGTEDAGAPTIYGHQGARGTFSVAATEYRVPMERAVWSAAGPFTVYFDADGRRLARPEVRRVPSAVAVEGTDTTFFGGDIDGNGFPNFSGTSASAPTAAGIAALTLQAAGGPGRLRPAQLYSLLQNTARPIAVPETAEFGFTQAGPLVLSANGYNTTSPTYFLAELAPDALPVRSMSIDLGSTTYEFGPQSGAYRFGGGRGVSPQDVSTAISADSKKITLSFKRGSFKASEAFNFGWIAYDTRNGGGPLSITPFELRGALLKVTLEDGNAYSGRLTGDAPVKNNRFTGAGLLDAEAAVKAAKAMQ